MLRNLIIAEFYKSIKHKSLIIAILLPSLFTFIFQLYLFSTTTKDEIEIYFKNYQEDDNWLYYHGVILFFYVLIFPLLASIFAYLLVSLENNSNGWQCLFSLPFRVKDIHFAKIIVLLLFIFFSFSVSFLVNELIIFCISFLKPDFAFQIQSQNLILLFVFFLRFFINSLPIAVIGYLLSFKFKNTLLVHIFLPLSGIMFSSKYWIYSYTHKAYTSVLSERKKSIKIGNWKEFEIIKNYEIICLVIVFFFIIFVHYNEKKLQKTI